jgi:hypothetical protein
MGRRVNIKINFFLLPVPLIPVVPLDLRISPRIFEQVWNGPEGILRGLSETDSWKNQEFGTVPLMSRVMSGIKNSRRYSQVKVNHQYQRHHRYWWQNLPPVSWIPVVHLGLRISPRFFEHNLK